MNLYFSSLLLVKEQNLPYLQAGREVFQSGDCFSMLINCIPYCLSSCAWYVPASQQIGEMSLNQDCSLFCFSSLRAEKTTSWLKPPFFCSSMVHLLTSILMRKI